jgi:hypothetical protein
MRLARTPRWFKSALTGAENSSLRPRDAERIRRLKRRWPREEAGESLTEAVLAMAMFSIVAVALSGTLTAAVSVHGFARDRTVAEQTAQDRLEYIRRLPYDSVGTTNGNPPRR